MVSQIIANKWAKEKKIFKSKASANASLSVQVAKLISSKLYLCVFLLLLHQVKRKVVLLLFFRLNRDTSGVSVCPGDTFLNVGMSFTSNQLMKCLLGASILHSRLISCSSGASSAIIGHLVLERCY